MDKSLFDQVVELTGLPTTFIEPRLESLLLKKGIDPDNMTVDELRLVLVDFLQEVILEAKESADQHDLLN